VKSKDPVDANANTNTAPSDKSSKVPVDAKVNTQAAPADKRNIPDTPADKTKIEEKVKSPIASPT